jgi:chromosome partitioning protein
MIIIACLSQKGGVGKSTIARLIAWTYASAGWRVKICDFNTKQLSSVKWVERRQKAGMQPEISAEAYSSVKGFKREPFDLLVVDGRPDSDNSSLDIARVADLCVLPTGPALDDLEPQIIFAHELREKGIPRERLLLVLNKITESTKAIAQARAYLGSAGYAMADAELSAMQSYQNAQNVGLAIAETDFLSLNEKADALAAEIVNLVNELPRAA